MRGGIRSVEIGVVQGDTRTAVSQQEFSGPADNARRVQVAVSPKELGLKEGAATIEVKARDGFWRPIRRGDGVIASAPVTIDVTPPTVEVLASTQYLHQGGGGVAVIRTKGGARAGVKVGEMFFPAFAVDPPGGGVAMALFALPWDLPDTTPITAWGEDEAGNSAARPLPSELKPRRFPSGSVDLNDHFLATKLPELLPTAAQIPPDQYTQAFMVVNRDLRKKAEDTKRQLAARTQPKPLWEGAFVQPRNTKVFSNFAESRSYRYNGRQVDTGVHLGFDLASVKHSSIPAANSGVVVFAGPLTIYGNAVVVDHGLGLQTPLRSPLVAERQGGRPGQAGTGAREERHHRAGRRRSSALRGRHRRRGGHARRVVGRPLDPRPRRQAPARGQRPAAPV